MHPSLLLIALSLVSTEPDTTLRLPRNGAVEIDVSQHAIDLRVGSSDVVTIRGASAELDGGTLSIGDDGGRRRRSRPSPDGPIEITVPSWARVDISSVTGMVTLHGSPDRLHVETVNGAIQMIGGGGSAELESVGGAVDVKDFRGSRLSIDGTGAAVTVANVTSSSLEVDNVNGGIKMTGIHVGRISASTVNGGIEFEGTFAPSGNYEFSSQNDNVTLTLPADVSARMRISTMNGELQSTQIKATVSGSAASADKARGKSDKKSAKGRSVDVGDDGERTFVAVYGDGAARVSIDVYNGNVIVKKKS